MTKMIGTLETGKLVTDIRVIVLVMVVVLVLVDVGVAAAAVCMSCAGGHICFAGKYFVLALHSAPSFRCLLSHLSPFKSQEWVAAHPACTSPTRRRFSLPPNMPKNPSIFPEHIASAWSSSPLSPFPSIHNNFPPIHALFPFLKQGNEEKKI
ncbi:hypothetical protein M433DRAFT_219190 [Acidomyces richmondensis BFW]|nr:hypothetical protein M433DRAFT_219190 [Acidomyces richmondensis BFW]